MIAVETQGLTKKFNSFKAVDGLDLRVPPGSIYGFLGPNGAGKTTTIKMLTGLSKPSSGTITICGKPVQFGSTKNRIDIGFLPDVPSFYDWMSAREFLCFTGDLFGIEDRILKKRVEYLLDLVGLKGVNKKVRGFSRGMKQRLGIAQALVNEPKVVFLDEPTSALDPVGRKEVMDIIAKLAGQVTVFFSTHILEDVERVCDRVVILNGGKAIIEDSMENLRVKYSNRNILLQCKGEKAAELIRTLRNCSWIEKVVEQEEGELRLEVSDMRAAQQQVPGMLHQCNMNLEKFVVQQPSLEDIFMKVVNNS